MSSQQLDLIIQVGHDLTAHKYHSLATGVVFFYDWFLTLEDEIDYIWSGEKSWIFWLFIANRYFPVTWQIWQIGVAYIPQSPLDTTDTIPIGIQICEKTVWYPLLVFVVCTFLAQVVLTIRIYAVTLRNSPITIGFAIIIACQLVLGICMITLGAIKGARPQLPIPFDAYHLCVYVQSRTLEIIYTSISLFFDFLAFSLIIFRAMTSGVPGVKIPIILTTVAEDSTLYFLVIFTSHLVLVLTLNLARESMQLLPAPAILVYLPVMISRIILSLKKSRDRPVNSYSLAENGTRLRSIKFVRSQRDTNGGGGDTPLDTFSAL